MNRPADSVLLLLLAVVTAGCAAGSPRTLQSVMASAMTADAKNFPNGQVQFTTTRIFHKPATGVTPFQVAGLASPNSIADDR